MQNIMYTSDYCPFCRAAYQLLDEKGVVYKKISVDANPSIWKEIHQKTGRSTVPQIYINGQYVGGYDDLSAAERSGELSSIING
ncbi:MAG: glutaredoxin 3 [Gammaproteobacteria bacterium]|nr:glutaredoxin 3 [Gammaproteobacteria bacterium]